MTPTPRHRKLSPSRLAALVLLAVLAGTLSPARAQEAPYRFDMGGGIGMSGYIGDASPSIFAHPGLAGSLIFRYLPDVRWALRTTATVMTLTGDTSTMDDVWPDHGQWSFRATAIDLGERVEFNFFPYGIGETYKRLRRWTPYLAAGVGLTLSMCGGESHFGFNVPMAVGFKYKLRERLNLALEFSMTKVFSDHVDGPLSDLHQIKSSFGKNTDWYSDISFSITYEFGKRCTTCHYVE